jgi:hypothetical protein
MLLLLLLLLCRRLGGGDGSCGSERFFASEGSFFVIERGFLVHEFRLWMCMVGMRSMAEDRIG